MVTFNYPNRHTYDQYRLTLAPGQGILPTSTHAANLLHPFNPVLATSSRVRLNLRLENLIAL